MHRHANMHAARLLENSMYFGELAPQRQHLLCKVIDIAHKSGDVTFQDRDLMKSKYV